MSKVPEFDWNRLNAYVDGELEAADAARVAAAVASDAALAREVAVLSQLKAVSAGALAVDAAEIGSLPLSSARPWATLRAGPWSVLAAALVLVAATALAMALLLPGGERDGELAAWRARAEAYHRGWLATDARLAARRPDGDLLVETSGAAPGRVPDLSAARLRLAHVVAATARSPGGLFAGYVGANGCRLGLWIAPAPAGLGDGLDVARTGDELSATWRVAGTGYEIIAHDMDEARFRAVADYLVRLTRRPAAGNGTRVAADPEAMTARCLG